MLLLACRSEEQDLAGPLDEDEGPGGGGHEGPDLQPQLGGGPDGDGYSSDPGDDPGDAPGLSGDVEAGADSDGHEDPPQMVETALQKARREAVAKAAAAAAALKQQQQKRAGARNGNKAAGNVPAGVWRAWYLFGW